MSNSNQILALKAYKGGEMIAQAQHLIFEKKQQNGKKKNKSIIVQSYKLMMLFSCLLGIRSCYALRKTEEEKTS